MSCGGFHYHSGKIIQYGTKITTGCTYWVPDIDGREVRVALQELVRRMAASIPIKHTLTASVRYSWRIIFAALMYTTCERYGS